MRYDQWGVISVTCEGVVLDADAEACSLLRQRREAVVGVRLRDVLDTFARDLDDALEAARTGSNYRGELCLLRGDGTTFFADVETSGFGATNGDGIRVIIRDVTGRKPAEEELRQANERFHALVQHSSDTITVLEADGTVRYVSPAGENVTGRRSEMCLGQNAFSFVHPDDKPRALAAFEEVLQKPGVHPPVEFRVPHKDGSWRYLEHVVNNLLDDPSVKGIVVTSRDITERVRAEEALREAEERYRMLVEQVPAVTYTIDATSHGSHDAPRHGAVTYMSPQIEWLLGYPPEAFEKDPRFWDSLIHPDDFERVTAEDVRTEKSGTPFEMEYRLRHQSGHWVWVRDDATLARDEAGEPLFWQGMFVDISRRKREEEEERRRLNEALEKRAEEALRASEERFRSLIRYASDIIVVLDAEGTILYESPAIERILGFKPEQMVGTSIFDRVHPDDVGWMTSKLADLLKGPRERTSMWYRIRDKEDSWHHFEAIATNLLHDPAVRGIVVNARDITERRRAEEALRESEELYRSVVEQAAENIFLIDPETKRILESNAALHRSLGYTAQELKQMTLYDIVAHEQETTDRNIGRVLEYGRYQIGKRKYRRKDGTLVDMEVSASALSYGERETHGGREALCVVARDISEPTLAELGAKDERG
jgi:PAS domain S-box-containing protein